MEQPDDDVFYDNYEYELNQEYEIGLDHINHFYFEERENIANSFEHFILIVVKSLNDRNIIIDAPDLKIIQDGIKFVPNSKFKNATGYVLGFYITLNQCIDKKKFNKVVKIIPELLFPISAPDILRYCNLWCKIVWPQIN